MGYYAAGDWYRGDPGINILGLAGRLMGPKAAPVAPTMARAATAATPPTSLLQRGAKAAGKALLGPARELGTGGIARGAARHIRRLMGGGRRRRMNVLNPRALRKALRRAEGFTRFARRVVKVTAPKRRVTGFRFRRRRKRT